MVADKQWIDIESNKIPPKFHFLNVQHWFSQRSNLSKNSILSPSKVEVYEISEITIFPRRPLAARYGKICSQKQGI
jgi:hypothetical protein